MPAVGLAPLVSKTHTGLTMDTVLNPHNISTHTHTDAAHLARVMSQRGGTRSIAAVLVSYPLLAKMQLDWGVVNKA